MVTVPVTISPHVSSSTTYGLYLRVPVKCLPPDANLATDHDPSMWAGFLSGTKTVVVCLRSAGIRAFNMEQLGKRRIIWTCRVRSSTDCGAIRVYIPSTDAERLLIRRTKAKTVAAQLQTMQVKDSTAYILTLNVALPHK